MPIGAHLVWLECVVRLARSVHGRRQWSFGRHLAPTNSTYRSNTSARDNEHDTTFDNGIRTIPDQHQILLDEQRPRASSITGISTDMARPTIDLGWMHHRAAIEPRVTVPRG